MLHQSFLTKVHFSWVIFHRFRSWRLFRLVERQWRWHHDWQPFLVRLLPFEFGFESFLDLKLELCQDISLAVGLCVSALRLQKCLSLFAGAKRLLGLAIFLSCLDNDRLCNSIAMINFWGLSLNLSSVAFKSLCLGFSICFLNAATALLNQHPVKVGFIFFLILHIHTFLIEGFGLSSRHLSGHVLTRTLVRVIFVIIVWTVASLDKASLSLFQLLGSLVLGSDCVTICVCVMLHNHQRALSVALSIEIVIVSVVETWQLVVISLVAILISEVEIIIFLLHLQHFDVVIFLKQRSFQLL